MEAVQAALAARSNTRRRPRWRPLPRRSTEHAGSPSHLGDEWRSLRWSLMAPCTRTIGGPCPSEKIAIDVPSGVTTSKRASGICIVCNPASSRRASEKNQSVPHVVAATRSDHSIHGTRRRGPALTRPVVVGHRTGLLCRVKADHE